MKTKRKSRAGSRERNLARRFYPGRMRSETVSTSAGLTPVLGIVGGRPDGKYTSLGEDPKPAVYTPLFRNYERIRHADRRIRGDGTGRDALRTAVQRSTRNSIFSPKTLTEHMGLSLFPARVAAIALGQLRRPRAHPRRSRIYGVMSHVSPAHPARSACEWPWRAASLTCKS